MKNPSLTPSKIELNFEPRQGWPVELPPLAWREIVVAGFSRLETPIEMSSRVEAFGDALKVAYPRLGLGELARLSTYQRSAHQPSEREMPLREDEWATVWPAYELRESENLWATFALLTKAPRGFCDWVDDKGISLRDLAPLRSLQRESTIQKLTEVLGALGPNKNLGVQALEWAVDLMISGVGEDEVFELITPLKNSEIFLEWHKWLRTRRFAKRSAQIKQMEQWVRRLSLPKDANASVVDCGDRLGVELRLFASGADELAAKVAQLQNMASVAHTNETRNET